MSRKSRERKERHEAERLASPPVALYSILGFIAISLIVRFARKGPVAE